MTFKQILDAVSQKASKAAYQSPTYKAMELVWSAEQNANDTLYVEKACTEAEWERMAIGSLEMLVGSERDAKVRKVFDRLGFKY